MQNEITPYFPHESIYPRRDELILSWLWDAFMKGVFQQTRCHYFSPQDAQTLNNQHDVMYVILDEGVYWNNEIVCIDVETVCAASALLCLVGRPQLVYHSQAHYDEIHPEKAAQRKKEAEMSEELNDDVLDDHPF